MAKTAIIYWSGTGNTEAMAKAIQAGLVEKGTEVDLLTVSEAEKVSLADYEKVAFGCPSMGDEVLEESEFDPYFTSIEGELKGKKVALFGSYGWGDGGWMRDWAKRVEADQANLFDEGFIVNEEPEEEGCKQYGRELAVF